MFTTTLSLVLGAASWAAPDGPEDIPSAAAADAVMFQPALRLMAGNKLVKTEAPGYASPCWADVDEDGLKDLIVGQFSGGKMMVYRNLGDGELGEGKWLEVDGKAVEVPGVW